MENVSMNKQSLGFLIVLCILRFSSGYCDENKEIQSLATPKHTTTIPNAQKKVTHIKGILVTGKEENLVNPSQKPIRDVQFLDLKTPTETDGLKSILIPYMGQEIHNDKLKEMLKEIVAYYKNNKLPPVSVKIAPKKTGGVIKILITKKSKKTKETTVKTKKPMVIKGIYITGKKENIDEKGKKGIKEVQIIDLDVKGKSYALKEVLQAHLGKQINKDEIISIQKEIINYYKQNKLPPISIKVSPKRVGGVVQILISPKTKKAPEKKSSKVKPKKKAVKKKAKKKAKKAPIVIKGIYITDNEADIIKEGRTMTGVQVTNLCFPCCPEADCCESLETILTPFMGKQATKKELQELRKVILKYYKDFVRPLMEINVFVKSIKGGVLQILITEKRIGNITFVGQKWWPARLLARIFDIHSGEKFNKERIKNNLAWLNQNIFHRSKIKFTPSKENPGDLDILITTKDRFPLRFYTIVNNNGIPSTGRERFSGGITWGNAFNNNDILTYEFHTGNIPKRYVSHTGNYLTYLPWKHRFSIFANYSKIKPAIHKHKNTSFSNQVRVRYTIPFKPLYTAFQHSAGIGFDLKYGNADSLSLLQPNLPHVIKKLQIAQLVYTYALSERTKKNYYWLHYNFYWSPGQLFNNQGPSDFRRKRPFSSANYAYYYVNLGDIYTFPSKFSIAGTLSIQNATGTLPVTEVFCIGGYNTVRGYKPCEFASDNGLITNLEFRSPPIGVLNSFSKIKDQLILLTFFDYGIGYNYHARETRPTEPNDHKTQYAMGVGCGLRYNIQQYLSFRCDYGKKLHHMHTTNNAEKRVRRGDDQWYLGLLLAY